MNHELLNDLNLKGFKVTLDLQLKDKYKLQTKAFASQCESWLVSQVKAAQMRARFDSSETDIVDDLKEQLSDCRDLLSNKATARTSMEHDDLLPKEDFNFEKEMCGYMELDNGDEWYNCRCRLGVFVGLVVRDNRIIEVEVTGIGKKRVNMDAVHEFASKKHRATLENLKKIMVICRREGRDDVQPMFQALGNVVQAAIEDQWLKMEDFYVRGIKFSIEVDECSRSTHVVALIDGTQRGRALRFDFRGNRIYFISRSIGISPSDLEEFNYAPSTIGTINKILDKLEVPDVVAARVSREEGKKFEFDELPNEVPTLNTRHAFTKRVQQGTSFFDYICEVAGTRYALVIFDSGDIRLFINGKFLETHKSDVSFPIYETELVKTFDTHLKRMLVHGPWRALGRVATDMQDLPQKDFTVADYKLEFFKYKATSITGFGNGRGEFPRHEYRIYKNEDLDDDIGEFEVVNGVVTQVHLPMPSYKYNYIVRGFIDRPASMKSLTEMLKRFSSMLAGRKLSVDQVLDHVLGRVSNESTFDLVPRKKFTHNDIVWDHTDYGSDRSDYAAKLKKGSLLEITTLNGKIKEIEVTGVNGDRHLTLTQRSTLHNMARSKLPATAENFQKAFEIARPEAESQMNEYLWYRRRA